MVVGRSAGGIGVELAAEMRRGIVPADGQPRILGGGDLGHHLRIVSGNAGEIHHLAETDDVRPGKRLGDILC
ncbi:hypothetical protein D3C71_1997790 [compost metagenome]